MKNGEPLFAWNDTRPLKPASVLKLVTSLAVLELLGPEHTFNTSLYVDHLKDSKVRTLYVAGGGDPGLTTEGSLLIARKLKRGGITKIERLAIDSSAFLDRQGPRGERAYQTGASALAFNYNGLMFEVCPSHAGQTANYAYDPFEIPVKVTGSVKTIKGRGGRVAVDGAGPGSYKLSGTIGEDQKCVVIYRSDDAPEKTFAAVFAEQLRALGIRVGKIEYASVPKEAALIYEHRSEPLSRAVEDLNHFSNNFIAEQLLFALGTDLTSSWSRERGLARLDRFSRELGVPPEQAVFADASGLSHENRLSASALVKVLLKAWRDQEIRPQFETSLSMLGESGTLKKRSMDIGGAVLRGKTGTIDGVASLAGYLYPACGNTVGFAVILNGLGFERGRQLEEDITALLADVACSN